ncbi:response regulator transcription factor [Bacillus marinisedimentorum]|uniref:response regulator transcription factor n=1 Tax=Bacillus marinisedimentorum TaxID=1821260 RepID=UPI000B2913F9|nr:response regulator transcription factor [Bacillus marinisedimentorum]
MRILAVDDEPMIIEAVEAYLENAGFEVDTAENGADALELFSKYDYQFILLDLMLPDISGEEVCQRIREVSDVPIMMLTAKTKEEDRINGIVIGADDYIVKPFSPKEVVVRIQGILRRTERFALKGCMSFNGKDMVINSKENRVLVRDEDIQLTPIEFKLLLEMAKYPGRAFSRMKLLEQIQEDGYYEGYERSIDVHIKNLRKKIEIDTKNPAYIQTVFGIGYRFGGKSDAPDITF